MRRAEAAAIAAILVTVDDGCGPCFDVLSKQMAEAFPQFSWWQLGKDAEEAARSLPDEEDE